MNNFREKLRNRYYQAYVSMLGTIQVHPRKPLVIALWSVAFPGFGHFLLHKFLRGYALFIWEFFINQKTQLNAAMMHTFNGNFESARDVLNEKYIYLYIPVYIFAIWDSYRTAIDENKLYLLAKRENAPFPTFTMNPFEMNYIDKKSPWVAFMWSLTIPSLGQLYIHRVFTAFLTLVMTLVVVYYSNMIEGMHYFLLGNFQKTRTIIDAQWFLYFPSIYFFSLYDTYINTVELNKLFNQEQARYLRKEFLPPLFDIQKGEKVT